MGNLLRLALQSTLISLFSTLILGYAYAEETKYTSSAEIARQNIAKLQEIIPLYQAAVAQPWPTVPNTTRLLRIGSQSRLIPIIRDRLIATRDLSNTDVGDDVYDQNLLNAVTLFQWRHGLKADGIIGPATIAEMNVPPKERLNEILVNLKRWEKFAKNNYERYILVNIPEYQLHVIDHGQEALTMKVIVGRPTRQTPELSSTVTLMEINPYWDVPQLLAQNDIVPKVIDDPHYLSHEHIRVLSSQEDNARTIPAYTVNWHDAEENGFRYHFRQDPGEHNALGVVRFEFQNSHSVYLHDTPHKELFSADIRDFSSGCIRLEHPLELVSYLIESDPNTDMDKIQSIIDSEKNTYYRIKQPIPIFITYFTAWVDNTGIVHFADDIYERDINS